MAFRKGNIPWNKGTKGLQAGEKNSFFGKHHSEETKKKQSEIKKGKHFSPETQFKKGLTPWNKNKKLAPPSEEIKRKQSESLKRFYENNKHPSVGKTPWNKGLARSEETCKKISETRLKRKIPPWNKGKAQLKTSGNNNPSKRPEVRMKISKSRLGVPRSEETKRKLSEYCGEKASNWLGGLSFEPYCHKFNERLKERIRERDNRTCQLCGVKENGRRLSVHHVHYDKPNCAPDLIALCGSCNLKVNINRDYWEAFFMNLLKKRELFYETI
jgi:hypothetical protein